MALEILTVSALLGMVSGLLAGLFGIGGGLVIVPVLVAVFKHWGLAGSLPLLMAVATSLAAIVPTALSATVAQHRLGAVVWPRVWGLAPGIAAGAGLGAVVADHLPARLFQLVIAAFLAYVGWRMARLQAAASAGGPPRRGLEFVLSLGMGGLSAIVGIGGGTLVVPYLVRGGLPMQRAVAVSSALGLPIAVAGALSYAALGRFAHGLPPWSLGYVYLPALLGIGLSSALTAPVGVKWAHRLAATRLKRYFSLLLWAMAVKLLWP